MESALPENWPLLVTFVHRLYHSFAGAGVPSRSDEINKLNAQLDTPVLSADAKAAKAKERDEKIANIKNMEREINDFRQTREQQLQQQMLRLQEGIVKEITDVVMERGKSRNMDLVFDKSGASLNRISLLYFRPIAWTSRRM